MPGLATNEQKLLTFDLAATPAGSNVHGSPREGASLAAATQAKGKPLREAILVLARGLFPEKLQLVFSQTFHAPPKFSQGADSLVMCGAWNLVMVCLTARSSEECSSRCGFQEAERWFRGESPAT